VLDGDVENSTHTQEFMKKFPERFIECFIAEQTMVGAASGLAALGRIAFVSTFSAFFTRAFDQVRVGAGISQLNLKLVGTHSGCSIGEDGPSQMGLEDLAMMRTVPGGVVLSPSDAVSTEMLIEKMVEHQGFCYMRTARAATPILYGDVKFEIGGARILHGLDPQVSQCATVVATGITVPEALRAAEILGEQRISLCVIDAYSIKPLARELILNAARETRNQLITVEDHYSEGGLGDAVAGELSQQGVQVKKLAVMRLPHSGKEKELLAEFAIDAAAIVEAVHAQLAQATLSESKRLPAA
jgi:transketolase